MRILIPIAVVLLAAGALAFSWRGGSDAAKKPQAVTPPRATGMPEPPSTVVADRVVPAPAEEPKGAAPIVFPDGTELPPLNGVIDPAPVRWPKDRPFSPVIKREVDPRGQAWYVHADGSKTTTVMIWRSDLGRHDSVTNIFNPLPGQERPIAAPAGAPATAAGQQR